MIRWLTWLLICCCLPSILGCSSTPRLSRVADDVGTASKLVLPMSRDAFTLLQAERDRLVAANLLTGDGVIQVDKGLTEADAVLKRAERGEKVTREELLKAIDAATLVNEMLVAVGGKPPAIVASAIDLARRVVGERER
jgi:hypothetical protein